MSVWFTSRFRSPLVLLYTLIVATMGVARSINREHWPADAADGYPIGSAAFLSLHSLYPRLHVWVERRSPILLWLVTERRIRKGTRQAGQEQRRCRLFQLFVPNFAFSSSDLGLTRHWPWRHGVPRTKLIPRVGPYCCAQPNCHPEPGRTEQERMWPDTQGFRFITPSTKLA